MNYSERAAKLFGRDVEAVDANTLGWFDQVRRRE